MNIIENRNPHKDSFYKRVLPDTCTAFNSKRGRQLFMEALQGVNMESYFMLSIQFLTQSEPAFCGIASLCMALNALEIDPVRQWKGVWRWWDESMLDCCRPLEEVKQRGITLPELACLARCNGLETQMKMADAITKEEFERDLVSATSTVNEIIIVSYSRAALGQTGSGHFSPVGGIHLSDKQVLIMDVARFKYPPSWVSIDLLWESLLPQDEDTKRSRGYLRLKRNDDGGTPCFTTQALSSLALNKSQWPKLFANLYSTLPCSFSLSPAHSLDNIVERFINAVPDEYIECVKDRRILFTAPAMKSSDLFPTCGSEKCSAERPSSDEGLDFYLCELNSLLTQISQLKLYSLVANSMAAHRKLLLRQASSILSAALVQHPQIPAALSLGETVASVCLAQLPEEQQDEYGRIINQIQALYPEGDVSASETDINSEHHQRTHSATSISSILSNSISSKMFIAAFASADPVESIYAPVTDSSPVSNDLPQICATPSSARLIRQLSISSTSAAPSFRSTVGLRNRPGLRDLSIKNLQCLTNPLYDSTSAKSCMANSSSDTGALLPSGSDPNDFLCFLTLFILAVFSFKAPFKNLDEDLVLQIQELTATDKLPALIAKEVQLLRSQITVLNDVCLALAA